MFPAVFASIHLVNFFGGMSPVFVALQLFAAFSIGLMLGVARIIATDFTIGGAIRGSGDSTYPLKISLFTLLIVRIILPFVFIYYHFHSMTLLYFNRCRFSDKSYFHDSLLS